jgi:hypothetical protein
MSARKNKTRVYAATKEVKVVPKWFKAYFEVK